MKPALVFAHNGLGDKGGILRGRIKSNPSTARILIILTATEDNLSTKAQQCHDQFTIIFVHGQINV